MLVLLQQELVTVVTVVVWLVPFDIVKTLVCDCILFDVCIQFIVQPFNRYLKHHERLFLQNQSMLILFYIILQPIITIHEKKHFIFYVASDAIFTNHT